MIGVPEPHSFWSLASAPDIDLMSTVIQWWELYIENKFENTIYTNTKKLNKSQSNFLHSGLPLKSANSWWKNATWAHLNDHLSCINHQQHLNSLLSTQIQLLVVLQLNTGNSCLLWWFSVYIENQIRRSIIPNKNILWCWALGDSMTEGVAADSITVEVAWSSINKEEHLP